VFDLIAKGHWCLAANLWRSTRGIRYG
jgi:hypothetical protein